MKENPKEYLSLDMKNLIDSCITKIEEFRMEAFIDYLKEKCTELKDIDFSIYNHESIILAILSYKYNTYTAQLLSYLLNRIPNSDLDMLIRSLKNSDTFYYFNDEQIKRYSREKNKYDDNDFQHYIESWNLDDDLSEVISEWKRIQNIFYWTHNWDERKNVELKELLEYYIWKERLTKEVKNTFWCNKTIFSIPCSYDNEKNIIIWNYRKNITEIEDSHLKNGISLFFILLKYWKWENYRLSIQESKEYYEKYRTEIFGRKNHKIVLNTFKSIHSRFSIVGCKIKILSDRENFYVKEDKNL